MEALQTFARIFFRNRNILSNCKSKENITKNELKGCINLESSNQAFIRIKKKIRRSKLKETLELYTELSLLLLAIMLLLISMHYFFSV